MRFAPASFALFFCVALAAPTFAQSPAKPETAKQGAATAKPVQQRTQPGKTETARPPAKPDVPKANPALLAAAQKMAGAFQLASADGTRICALTLKADAASGGGFALDLQQDGCAAIPFAPQLQAWTPDPSGSIRLTGPEGRTVAEFTEATGGSYEALREGDGVYFLAPPSAGHGMEAAPEEMVGDWNLYRAAGAQIQCRWTLAEAPASTGAGRQVLVAPGCAPGLAEFAPVSWRLEGGNVVVASGTGQTPLRFARQEDGTWAKTPERGRPLLLIRP